MTAIVTKLSELVFFALAAALFPPNAKELPACATSQPASAPASQPGQAEATKAAQAFWCKMAEGSAAAIAPFYADKVTLLAGSELLKPEWGLPGADRNKDLVVERQALVDAYGRMMGRAGQEKWRKAFQSVKPENLEIKAIDGANRFPSASKGDCLLTVWVGRARGSDDRVCYVLRRGADGRWQVIAEQADY